MLFRSDEDNGGCGLKFCVVTCVVTPRSLPVSRGVGGCRSGTGEGQGQCAEPAWTLPLPVASSQSLSLGVSVTAEVASSSLVVPAIHSKAVRRISFKPLRTQKGHVSRPFCALFNEQNFPIRQRVALHPYRKKRPAISPPPALHASRALLPACKRPA